MLAQSSDWEQKNFKLKISNLLGYSVATALTFPLSATASTAALEVPYMLPENSAVSMNSPSFNIWSMVSRSEKL